MTKRIAKMAQILVLAGLLIGLALAPALAKERKARFAIANMTCASCPVIVKRAMESVDGVMSVSVSYEEKEAVVTYDDTRTSPEAIAEASTKHGYPARIVEDNSSKIDKKQ